MQWFTTNVAHFSASKQGDVCAWDVGRADYFTYRSRQPWHSSPFVLFFVFPPPRTLTNRYCSPARPPAGRTFFLHAVLSDTHSPGSLVTGSVTDVTLPAWDTPKNKRRPLITPGGIGRLNGRLTGGSGGGPAADTPDMSPLWGGRHDGASPALSAITAADISPYHVEDATLHTPGGGRRGGRHGLAVDETREEEMDISSAARDLREFKAGAGGARAPSSADAGSGRAGGLKAGRSKGECRA